MMGQLSSGQERLFYSFNLEDHIPANHLLRSIDRCLDLSDLRHYFADFYSPIGRPSIDPELMIRMLIVGYCYGIRSERRLCEEAQYRPFPSCSRYVVCSGSRPASVVSAKGRRLISVRFTSCMPPVIGISKHTRGHTRREVIGGDRDG